MALNPKVTKIARQKVGLYLSGIRKDKHISRYRIAKDTGLTETQVLAIERGSSSYTFDSFMAYVSALDCYFYLANKDDKDLDLDHLVKQMNNPV